MSTDLPETSRVDSAEIDPLEVGARVARGALLLDVREEHESALGRPVGATGVPRERLIAEIATIAASVEAPLILICATGRRSLLARESLREKGYGNVVSVRGGFQRWAAQGLPVEQGAVDADAAERYARHLILPEIGIAGQARLSAARVVLIGAGGLGAPSSLYLAAAGIGTLTLIDDDKVERSNLQRQVIHAEARVGMDKTESARTVLQGLNPRCEVRTHSLRLRAGNVEDLLGGHDLVIDGADNFPTRYLIDAAARRLRIPMVYGAVHRFSGQVSVFDPRRSDSPCYRCLFPEPPSAAEAPNCSEAGVLGVLPGIIGLLQANEALKLILGLGQPLTGRLLCFDALATRFRELALARDPACPGCGPGVVFPGYADIAQLCATSN